MHEPTFGNNSLTSMPLRPCLRNFQGEERRLRGGANSNAGLANGSGLPFISASFGLGSKVSTCETPPCMKRKITRRGRGREGGGVGGRGGGRGAWRLRRG